MSGKIVSMRWAHKAVAVTVVCGALTLGSATVASAATTTTPATPVAGRHLSCARAPKALTRISKVESAIARRLPKLQAAETKATAAGNTTRATRLERRIHRLQRIDTRAGTRAKKINAKCPTGTTGTTGNGSTSAS